MSHQNIHANAIGVTICPVVLNGDTAVNTGNDLRIEASLGSMDQLQGKWYADQGTEYDYIYYLDEYFHY